MDKPKLGGYQWSEATDGTLSLREVIRYVGMLAQAQVRELVGLTLSRLPLSRKARPAVSVARVPVPETTLVHRSREQADAVYSRALKAHCYRTYLFAALLGQALRLRFDAETLLTASLLHDLGLTEKHNADVARHCFAVTGARQAKRFCHTHGATGAQSERIYEAISLHLNPVVSAADAGAEAALLARGATLDVIGSDLHRLPEPVVSEVLARHPRDGFAEEIAATMQWPHGRRTRANLLRCCGFQRMAHRHPLDR